MRTTMIAAGLLLLAATGARAATGMAHLTATDESAKAMGHLELEETSKGLHISGRIENAPAGQHGFHIHQFGACGDKGKAAGDHYNPSSNPHGHVIKDGPEKAHAGDMGNVTVSEDGTATIDLVIPAVTLIGGKYPVAGRAVVLHEKKDDFGQPTGNAGGRIGCGPIVITGK